MTLDIVLGIAKRTALIAGLGMATAWGTVDEPRYKEVQLQPVNGEYKTPPQGEVCDMIANDCDYEPSLDGDELLDLCTGEKLAYNVPHPKHSLLGDCSPGEHIYMEEKVIVSEFDLASIEVCFDDDCDGAYDSVHVDEVRMLYDCSGSMQPEFAKIRASFNSNEPSVIRPEFAGVGMALRQLKNLYSQ